MGAAIVELVGKEVVGGGSHYTNDSIVKRCMTCDFRTGLWVCNMRKHSLIICNTVVFCKLPRRGLVSNALVDYCSDIPVPHRRKRETRSFVLPNSLMSIFKFYERV